MDVDPATTSTPEARPSSIAPSSAIPVVAVNAVPGPFDISDDDEFCHPIREVASSVRRRPRPATLTYSFLRSRELGNNIAISDSLYASVERKTLQHLDSGQYVTLDRSAPQVRSTISIAFSHDGRFFASTHGDHTVKVFDYPSGLQIACLEGHPRTPWTVRFHPSDSDIIASGCLGSDCRVWNVREQKCIRKRQFGGSISCVSFSPDGDLLAVTSGRSLLLWDYMNDTRDAVRPSSRGWQDNGQDRELLRELLSGHNPFHMVDFHPSGTMLMTGEKNRFPSPPSALGIPPEDQQFTLRLEIHRFDRRVLRKYADPVLVVPRAVAYNDAGIHFSPCGTMLAACIPLENSPMMFRLAIISVINRPGHSVGSVMYQTPLDRGHVTALTNLKFSATSRHLLAGFSFRPSNPVLVRQAELFEEVMRASNSETHSRSVPQVRVVNIYKVGEGLEMIRSLCADMDVTENYGGETEDEINVAVFAPMAGVANGVVYGTQKGRIRMFRPVVGRISEFELELRAQGLGHVIAFRNYVEGDPPPEDYVRDVPGPSNATRAAGPPLRRLLDVRISSNGSVFRIRNRSRRAGHL